ncbi:LemA family protein [Alkalihalophilus pseudofirmus]|uniref:LemA family protein n=1 Tax=Alkalihalophilus pseudofirmus TaxID=79885 RepID=UPI00259B4C0B|nr:LemA family protein [Alkalihalophilus pseudofirmus]WEG18644.1 LemA family protein [Alkalihalophilus pseudofirmus]
MTRKIFGFLIAIGILISVVVVAISLVVSVQNKAINLEEQIFESSSAIEIQEKRRVDLVHNLVDTVQSYDNHERGTMTELTEARAQANSGNIEEARLSIQAITEAYPDLKSVENYQTLMTELSATENLIAEHRKTYNIQVRAYNKHVRQFPNRAILDFMGYEQIDSDYLEYDAPSDAPTDLFNQGEDDE